MSEVSRRIVVLSGGATGAAFVLGLISCGRGGSVASQTHSWVSIAKDGIVTVRVNSAEIGQGAQTGLAQLVAEELDADWSQVRVEMAPVIDAYFVKDGNDYYTGGSSSIAPQFALFRKAGATARAMLIAAAAEIWSVTPAGCDTTKGLVRHTPTGRTLGYGILSARAATLAVPDKVALKPREQWTTIGKPVARFDIPDKVVGRARYGIDVRLPGMLVATLAQSPWFDGRLTALDGRPALAVKGVRKVVPLGNAVAVVATNFWAARKGLNTLSPQWSKPANPIASDADMFSRLKNDIGVSDAQVITADRKTHTATLARVAVALAHAKKVVEAEYQVPLLSHSPIEPMNATAHVTATSCELWAPMQAQGDMREALAKVLGLPRSAIVLHTTLAGGGFGRRLETDYGVFAARISQAAGTPVKLVFTREEDMSHDFYRPASSARLRAALDKSMRIRALDYSGATTNDTAIGGMIGNYDFDVVVRQKKVTFPLPVGAWRSVDPSITIFMLESFIDEVAHEAGIDPLAYRRMLLANNPRAMRVLNAAAELANWKQVPPGRFQGLAYFAGAGWRTHVAEIIELSVDASGKITLHRVVCAIDPGIAVNPNAVMAQAEGGIVMGLSAALGEVITVKDGRAEQRNFGDYSILRLAAAPEITVRVLETSDAPPGGVGEPPVPPVAAALANAIFAATGNRVRSLPLSRHGYAV